MKFLLTLIFALLTNIVAASTRTVHSVRPRLVKKRSLKQFNPLQNIEKRGLVDVCVSLNLDLAAELSNALHVSVVELLGTVDICLCVGGLDAFMEANIEAALAAEAVGADRVKTALTTLINTANGRKTCHYPDHAQQLCTSPDVCDFTCIDGYTEQGSECVCKKAHICGGQCQDTVCFDAQPTHGLSKRLAHAECPRGFDMCGVLNGAGLNKRGYECLETERNLESCGGCAIPLLAGQVPTGQDCTTITNALGVSCVVGSCVVTSCRSPWIPDATRASCVLPGSS